MAEAKKTTRNKPKPAAKKPVKMEYVVANDTFFVGGRVMVEAGHIYDKNHELVGRYPGKFDPVGDAAVEAATATPGQLRNATIPKG